MANLIWTDENGQQHETKSSRWAEKLDQPLMLVPAGMEKFAFQSRVAEQETRYSCPICGKDTRHEYGPCGKCLL
jgi:hypothetical protein